MYPVSHLAKERGRKSEREIQTDRLIDRHSDRHIQRKQTLSWGGIHLAVPRGGGVGGGRGTRRAQCEGFDADKYKQMLSEYKIGKRPLLLSIEEIKKWHDVKHIKREIGWEITI